MIRKLIPAVCVAAWAWSLAVAADDEKKAPVTTTPDKMPEWSKTYVAAGEIWGEVVKADDKGITLQVTELAPNGSGGYKSGKGKGKGGGSGVKEKKTEIDLKYADGGMVRWVAKPKKTDAKGKTIALTPKEQEDLQKPIGSPGYAAARTDLLPGHVVEIRLLRPKTISAKDAKISDLEIKYVLIQGTDPKPPSISKDEEKKKDNETGQDKKKS
jgi:hypothetical protein